MNTSIEIEISPIDEAVEAILEKINDFFLKDVDDKFVSLEIETEIGKLIDELKEDLFCVIEYPYVDKVYRDSYYHYYSSKHYTYQRDCIRVSLFNGEISHDDFLNPERHSELNNKFLV